MVVDGQVLVLNRSWVAVNVTSVRRALVLLFQGHARVVHPEGYALYDFDSWRALSELRDACPKGRFIHTPGMRIRLPEVILLGTFNGFIRREVRLSRRNIFERDHCLCQYCGKHLPRAELTIDHVVPRCP